MVGIPVTGSRLASPKFQLHSMIPSVVNFVTSVVPQITLGSSATGQAATAIRSAHLSYGGWLPAAPCRRIGSGRVGGGAVLIYGFSGLF